MVEKQQMLGDKTLALDDIKSVEDSEVAGGEAEEAEFGWVGQCDSKVSQGEAE